MSDAAFSADACLLVLILRRLVRSRREIQTKQNIPRCCCVSQVKRRALRPSREQLGLPPLNDDELGQPRTESDTRGGSHHQSVDEQHGLEHDHGHGDPEVVFHPNGIDGGRSPREVDRGGSILAQSRMLAPRSTSSHSDHSTSQREAGGVDSSPGRQDSSSLQADDPEVVHHRPSNGGRIDRGGGILAQMQAARSQPQQDEDAESIGALPSRGGGGGGGSDAQHDNRGLTSHVPASTGTDHDHDDILHWLRSADEPGSQREHASESNDDGAGGGTGVGGGDDDDGEFSSESESGVTGVESEGSSGGAWAGELDAADEERIRAAGDLV